MIDDELKLYARALRLATIKSLVKSEILSREEAMEVLRGPLSPGDDSTIVDDSDLLDKSSDELVEMGFLSA